jgi:cell division protease FtsH
MSEDVGGFAASYREFVERMTELASAQARSPVRDRIDAHLGADSAGMPVVLDAFEAWDHINVQTAMDAWLAEPGRTHELFGLMGSQRHVGSLADIAELGRHMVVRPGSVDLIDLPIGPDETLVCVNFGIYLVTDAASPMAVMMRRGHDEYGESGLRLEVQCADPDRARAFLADIRRLMRERNRFRGQVVAFGESHVGRRGVGPVVFLGRPDVPRGRLVMSPGVLESVEREVFGIARHRERLRASGQHVKRGLLLHGPPGTGKTLTVRYLMGALAEHTVCVLTGGGLGMIRPACSLARMLQPSVVVLEDIDLVAMDRSYSPFGSNPLLFDVLNEMDGIAEDADVTFVLTTNRVDLLERALAARPGRVDLAVELGLPQAEARRRLIELYGEGLDLRLDEPDRVVERTDGVTASFIKELMRKSALLAAEDDPDGSGSPVVTDAHVNAALDELLAERSALTRSLLGGASRGGDEPDFEPPPGGMFGMQRRRAAHPTVYEEIHEDEGGGHAISFGPLDP